MNTGRIVLVTVLAGVLGIGFALFSQQWLNKERDIKLPLAFGRDSGTDRLDRVPEFRLPDIRGEQIASSRWAGKVLVLNFWATWCPPCLRELPLLEELQREHPDGSLQVVGIAIDDSDDVEQFLAEHPVGFPILLGDTSAIEMSRRLGNRMQGLPFTAIFDHRGQQIFGQIGEMTRASLSEHLVPLLSQADETQSLGN